VADSNVRLVSPEQVRRVATHLGGDRADQRTDAIAGRIADTLGVRTAVLTRRRGTWRIAASSGAVPLAAADAASVLDRLPPDAAAPERMTGRDAEWTVIRCGSTALALEHDWTLSGPLISILGQTAALAIEAAAARARRQRFAESYRLSRRLATAETPEAVSRTIVRFMARAARAAIATVAIADESGCLSIAAAHGYPLALVEHVRIEPGAGILGEVLATGRAVHVTERSQVPRPRRRPRYRTDSFVAVPMLGNRRVVGVAAVTDRIDGAVFTRDDLATLRALAAPAALAIERTRAVSDAEAHAEAAALDPLTGTFNRRHFHIRLDEELQRARRHAVPVALLMVDIDDFKIVNDSFGHLAGDTIIKDVADILRRSVRVFDICARFGGEEFAIIMPGSGAESAVKVGERIRERIELHRPIDPVLAPVRVTVSVGLAVAAGGETPRDLVARADRALYQAKRKGKNLVISVGGTDERLLTGD
jgi:diguanylate cyclase (GGDEF)-like protein